MKNPVRNWTSPSNKEAAMNQAVYALAALERSQEKEAKYVATIDQLTEKIHSIEEKIQELQDSLDSRKENSAEFQKRLKYLQTEWNLTQSEILEHRSALLRKQITQLQLQAQATKLTGDCSLEENPV